MQSWPMILFAAAVLAAGAAAAEGEAPAAVAAPAAKADAEAQGKIVFKVAINIVSSLPSNALPICDVTLSVVQISSDFEEFILSDSAARVGTRKGKTASCAVTVPYRWAGVEVGDDMRAQVLVRWETDSTKSGAVIARVHANQSLRFPVPDNGKTTTKTLTVDF